MSSNFAALASEIPVKDTSITLEYFFKAADPLIAFNSPICAYFDFEFDDQNIPHSFIIFSTFPGTYDVDLPWDFACPLTFGIITDSYTTTSEHCQEQQFLNKAGLDRRAAHKGAHIRD